MGEKWIFDDYSYLYKGLTELLQETLATRKTRKAENSQRALKYFCEQIKKANIQTSSPSQKTVNSLLLVAFFATSDNLLDVVPTALALKYQS
ncbi:hypothetical protein [Candidatus Thiodubiliella endoseptemdiera]|uniref:hypothetical protein n=1 Tax=Candidatus Thiodubiliella endoseptemdiera TaxID=2738886 RepID=UPI0034DE4531